MSMSISMMVAPTVLVLLPFGFGVGSVMGC